MFDPDIHLDIPTAIIAETGLDPHAVREVIEHDRAMRCPDKKSVLRGAPAQPFGRTPEMWPADWRGVGL